MLTSSPSPRRFHTTFRVSDLVLVAVCSAVVAVWVGFSAGRFSPAALLTCLALFLSFYLTGSLAAAWRPLAAGILFDLPARLLVGYSVVNTSLFVLAWMSPLGIVANFGIVLGLVAGAFAATQPDGGGARRLFRNVAIGLGEEVNVGAP
jgi:hypothetical protein